MYRAALIGCGKIGSEFDDPPVGKGIHTHAGAYAACPATRLVALCDADPARLARCGDRWQVAARYTNPFELLTDERPEIVSLCTPDDTHAALLRAALQTPGVKAVLVEKPLALTLAEARELERLADTGGVILAVNYSRRFAASCIALKKWLDAGGLGKLQAVCGYYVKGLLHNGTHWLDLARYLIGKVESVRGLDRLHEPGSDPTLDVELEFASGARGYMFGLDTRYFTIFEMDLVGTEGRIRLAESGHSLEAYKVADSRRYANYHELARVDSFIEGGLDDVILHAVEDVVRCLSEGGQPRCTGRDGVAALEIAFAVRASVADGQWRGVNQ
jgi:predicted dehydrogenase